MQRASSNELGHLVLCTPALANTSNFTVRPQESEEEQYFITVPQDLSSADGARDKAPRLGALIEGPKGKQVQQCTRTCVPTCIRGGQGAPGLGPMSVRREIVVFKEGFRSRKYCLSECTQVCALEANAVQPKERQ
ncbi:hypothetical protein N2152v2_007945 [Parachlorella kessleri]